MIPFMLMMTDPAELIERARTLRLHAKEARRRPHIILRLAVGESISALNLEDAAFLMEVARVAEAIPHENFHPEGIARQLEAEACALENFGTSN